MIWTLQILVESFFTAVFFGAVLVWTYNRYLPGLRESHIKKAAALGVLPLAMIAGIGHAIAVFSGWPHISLFAYIGAMFVVIKLFTFFKQRRLNQNIQSSRIRLGISGINYKKFSYPFRILLFLLRPINGVDDVVLVHKELTVPDLHPDMDGYRLLFLTDFHVHHWMTTAYFRRILRYVLKRNADALLVGGDFLSKRYCTGLAVETLKDLRKHPNMLAVRGNHDFWTRPSVFTKAIADWGGKLLINDIAELTRGDGKVLLVGLEHPYVPLTPREEERLKAELSRPARQNIPRIALVHTPECYPAAARLGCSLAFAGHTHGGQVRLPFFGTTIAACDVLPEHAWGCGRVGQTQTITSNGLGAFYPLRFLCPPQIIEVVLRATP